jgi:uncharacterized protein YndB with AHSA1/START domain
MSKRKFETEYELNASRRMLYPYFNTASGLTQWFADNVTIDEDHVFHFYWDEEEYKAKMVAQRLNNFVKFEFLPDGSPEPSYIEFNLQENELTQSTFIQIIEYSDIEDQDEQMEIWTNLLSNLKLTVGG